MQGYCLVAEADVCESDAECSDGLFCNGVELCNPGADTADDNGCMAGAAPALDDGFDCTEDICDEAAGEVRHIRGADCICASPDDHQACAAIARSQGLVCVAPTCNDQLGCEFPAAEVGTTCGEAEGCLSAGQCDEGGQCQRSRDDAACDDMDACNGAEVCNPDGTCAPGDPVNVDDGIACTVDSCADGEVINDPAGCDCQTPGDACACVGDGCQEGNACVGYICSDSFSCGEDDIAFMAAGTSCEDGVACTFDDVCDGEGGCRGTLDNNLCSNFDICDGEEICDPDAPDNDINGCIDGVPPNLDDGIDCTQDRCENNEIIHEPVGCELCNNDEECVPDQGANACLRYFCNDICMTEPLDEGTLCDDGRGCTDGDTCDGNGQCIGREANDTFCNDEMWCDGIEICQPNHQMADEMGCRPGPAPDPNDDVACTDDACVECDPEDLNCSPGLEGELVNTPTERCECIVDGDCAEDAEVCFVGTCTEGPYTCEFEAADVGTACDDGVGCTDGDQCDADQACVPQVDNCECEVDSDCTEDDDNVCILDGTCDDGVCNYTFAADDVSCSDAECAQGSTCDGLGTCELILDDAACEGTCRNNATCDPENGDDQGCVFEPANEGACVINCGNGDVNGTCAEGACAVPPEGPTGDLTCTNEIDDDCNGQIDLDDSACGTPDTVTVGGDDSGTVDNGVILTVDPGLTNQTDNLYCVGRLESYFESFDDAAVIDDIEESEVLTAIGEPGNDLEAGVTYEGETGLKICNGKGLLIGPFPQPALGDQLGLMLRIRMASMNPNGIGVNERFVVSFRNDETGSDDDGDFFVPMVGLDLLDSAIHDYQNVLFNGSGFGPVTIRLELINRDGNSDPNRCAFIESVGMYEVPFFRLEPDAVPAEIDYLQWTWGGRTEDAEMEFEPGDGSDADLETMFFTELPDGADLRLEGRAKHSNAKGMQWDNGNEIATIRLPEISAVPENLDRSESVRLDWAMAMRNRAVWAGGDAMDAFFGYNEDLSTFRKIGTALPEDAPHPYVTQYKAGENGSRRVQHRFVVELPEEMKPLLDRQIGFAKPTQADGDSHGYLDDIDIYVRNHDNYMSFVGNGPQNNDSSVHEVTLTSQHPGRVRVQCYWQLPGQADTPTVASDSFYVTITE